jgi:hypothetical protein
MHTLSVVFSASACRRGAHNEPSSGILVHTSYSDVPEIGGNKTKTITRMK